MKICPPINNDTFDKLGGKGKDCEMKFGKCVADILDQSNPSKAEGVLRYEPNF